MGKKLLLFCVVLHIFACQSCRHVDKVNETEKMTTVNLNKVQITECVIENRDAGGNVIVTIKGILPNPSYRIERVDSHIKNGKIVLTPWMSNDPSLIVIQMTVPFEEKVELANLENGKDYVIEIVGEQRVVAQELRW